MTTGNPLDPDSTVEGRVVIVGYGITAPELKHDDYAGIDVRGKIVGFFSGAPSTFANTVRAHYSNSTNKLENAVLRGSDPALRDQYLVYSAHLDHHGVVEAVNADSINNGALDNASGIAAMIEIARAFASRKAPKRSIIFLATTAEEKGLRGADYFANNPTVPIDQVVGNINIDQIMMLHPVKDIVPLGIEVSSLGDMARKVARAMGLEISPDPYPEEVYFVRSDQYPFVKRGVPALYVGTGYRAVDPNIDAKKEQIEWIKTVYHTPKDDLNQKIDYSVGSMLARFNYLLGLEAANSTSAPAWTPGNFFGEGFGRS